MTEKEAQNLICSNNLLLSQLLRVDKSNNVNNVPSFLKKIAEATKTQCKKWVSSGEYKAGDIIAYNSIIYICKEDNTDKNPEIFRAYWIKIILPYASNKGKLKAYVVAKINLDKTITIIKSYNINYVSTNSYTNIIEFEVNSTINLPQSSFFGFLQTNNSNRYMIKTNLNFTATNKRVIQVQAQTGTSIAVSYTAEPIFTVCIYNTDTTIY